MASMAGKAASTPYHPIYNISKAAVIAMTKTFALALATVRTDADHPICWARSCQQHYQNGCISRLTARVNQYASS
jgi:NAD(P)-dependent dehydrogenase (short-subunit alcohol dehydrogenase family)